MNSRFMFDVETPLGFNVHVTFEQWSVIIGIKHQVMRGREFDVQNTLQSPDEVRVSRIDPTVSLFYRNERPGRWICVVVKRPNGDGFLITAYPTDAIKQGEQIWIK